MENETEESTPEPTKPTPEKTGLPEWGPKFLEVLAETGNKTVAARAANVNRQYAYECKSVYPELKSAWAEAEQLGVGALEDEATRRAFGVEEDVYSKDGMLVGTKTRYSDVLLMFLLKSNRPEKYREQLAKDVRLEAKAAKGTTRIIIEATDPKIAAAVAGVNEMFKDSDDSGS